MENIENILKRIKKEILFNLLCFKIEIKTGIDKITDYTIR